MKTTGLWRACGAAALLAAFCGGVEAQDTAPAIPAVTSKIDRVLLYSDRAMVVRSGRVTTPAGRSRVAFEGLPGKLYDHSVAAALQGPAGAQIANIEVEPVFRTTFRKAEAEEAERDLRRLEREMRALQDQRAQALAEAAFAQGIKIGARPTSRGEATPLPIAPEAWGKTLDFLATTVRDAAQRDRELAEATDDLRAKIVVAAARARLLLSYKEEQTKRVILEIASDKATECRVDVIYIIPDAGWFPRYDVRADLTSGRVELVGYGLVRQESGEDWSEAELSFSAAEPSLAAALPELTSWRIAAVEPQVVMPDGVHNGVINTGRNDRGAQTATGTSGTSQVDLPYAYARLVPPSSPPMYSVVQKRKVESDAFGVAEDVGRLNSQIAQTESIANESRRSGLGDERKASAVGAGYLDNSARVEKQVVELETLNRAQQDARQRKDWNAFLGINGKMALTIQNTDASIQKGLAPLKYEVQNNCVIAQRWLESQKLESGLVAPVKSSGGYDYRWRALRRESVPSDGALTKVVLFRQEFNAEFVYEIAARKSKLAFLRTRLKNTTRSPFLEGPASVFLGSDFVGESSLSTCAPTEDFTIGLGADEEIAVERRTETKRDTRGLISTDYRFNVESLTTVRNGKQRAVKVVVFDRVPFTWDKKLTISEPRFAPDPTGWLPDKEKPKLVRWEFDLQPGGKQEVTVAYWFQHADDLRAVPVDDPSVKW